MGQHSARLINFCYERVNNRGDPTESEEEHS